MIKRRIYEITQSGKTQLAENSYAYMGEIKKQIEIKGNNQNPNRNVRGSFEAIALLGGAK